LKKVEKYLTELPDAGAGVVGWTGYLLALIVGLLATRGSKTSSAFSFPFKGTVPQDFRLQVFYMDQFSPSLKTLVLFSGAWEKMIHEKNLKQKSRNTVPLIAFLASFVTTVVQFYNH
jgi:hypothetical protein